MQSQNKNKKPFIPASQELFAWPLELQHIFSSVLII